MNDPFKDFLDDEIDAMLASMDPESRANPDVCSQKAMDWIDKNAVRFRDEWNRRRLQPN
jgi:hypothetical protein